MSVFQKIMHAYVFKLYFSDCIILGIVVKFRF